MGPARAVGTGCYAAVEPAEELPELDEEPEPEEDDDEDEPESEDDDEDAAFEDDDAGELLDELPRLSLR
ncbi:hypothetical protein STENM327S_05569 [Streptomyces tendae]